MHINGVKNGVISIRISMHEPNDTTETARGDNHSKKMVTAAVYITPIIQMRSLARAASTFP